MFQTLFFKYSFIIKKVIIVTLSFCKRFNLQSRKIFYGALSYLQKKIFTKNRIALCIFFKKKIVKWPIILRTKAFFYFKRLFYFKNSYIHKKQIVCYVLFSLLTNTVKIFHLYYNKFVLIFFSQRFPSRRRPLCPPTFKK